MRNVYLINLSFGLAGIERRFANLWHALHRRQTIFPILVVPASLASLLADAGLLPSDPRGLIVTPEPRWIPGLRVPDAFSIPLAIARSRIAALGYRGVWSRVGRDRDAVVHVGMNTSALRPPDVPAVYECVDANLEQFDTRHYRRASKRRCIIHCQTDRIRAALDACFAGRAPRWQTISNPTYFAQYDEPQPTVNRESRLVVFVGRLALEKNPFLFIDAIARVRARGIDCRAVMLGEGPLRTQCEARIKQLGLKSVVRIDFLLKHFEVLRRAAVYVTLQPGDNYGSQSLLEAMGAGCAIVASDVGETRNIVTDDVGIRAALTVESVAGALERLLTSPDTARQFGSAAERIARTRFSADSYAAFLESVYEIAARYHNAESEEIEARTVSQLEGKSV